MNDNVTMLGVKVDFSGINKLGKKVNDIENRVRNYSSFIGVSAPDTSRINSLNNELTNLQADLQAAQAEVAKYKRWLDECSFLNSSCKNRNKDLIAQNQTKVNSISARIAAIQKNDLPAAQSAYQTALAAYTSAKSVEASADPNVIMAQAQAQQGIIETEKKAETTKYVIIGIVGFIVVAGIVITIAYFSKKKKV